MLIDEFRPILSKLLSEIFDVNSENQINFIIKMKVDLLRLFTPEFLHFNIMMNMQKQGEQYQQLISSYFSSLFYLEIF